MRFLRSIVGVLRSFIASVLFLLLCVALFLTVRSYWIADGWEFRITNIPGPAAHPGWNPEHHKSGRISLTQGVFVIHSQHEYIKAKGALGMQAPSFSLNYKSRPLPTTPRTQWYSDLSQLVANPQITFHYDVKVCYFRFCHYSIEMKPFERATQATKTWTYFGPLWGVVGILAVMFLAVTNLLLVPILLPAKYVRRVWRKRKGLCLKCGYDIRATPDRCPECGAHPSNKVILKPA